MSYQKIVTTEVIRPAATLLTPGLVAVAPYWYVAVKAHPDLLDIAGRLALLSAVVGLLIVFAVGLLMQEFGSRFEALVIDNLLTAPTQERESDGFRYLRSSLPADSLARDYVDSLVLRLNFELNMTPALIACWFGLVWMVKAASALDAPTFLITTLVLFGSAWYLGYEALCTAAALARVRKELGKEYGMRPTARETGEPARRNAGESGAGRGRRGR